MANVKIKLSDNIVILLSNLDDNVCLVVNYFDTLSCHSRNKNFHLTFGFYICL